MQTSARPRTLVLVVSDLVTEIAMLGPRGDQLGARQVVPVTSETAGLWQAISVLGELDRITCVGTDTAGIAARVARESQRPLRAMTWGELHWSARIAGRGVELVIELSPQLRSTLFHDGVEVPGLDIGALRASKHRSFREYLAPRVLTRRGADTWTRRVTRSIDRLLAAWHPTTLYLSVPDELSVSPLPANVRVVPPAEGYRGALRPWAADGAALSAAR